MKSLLGTPDEWKDLGFHAGLEIHHQIQTEKKLFCRCPADHYREEWHAEVVRHMRPTMSELGEYDGTALMEFKTKKEIHYRLNRECVCTYEMDDTPPFPINEEAVDKAIVVALAFQCKMVGELHVIRKQYLDGSIPTGFQRTTIVGVDGVLPLSSGREIRVVQIGLEEDSCREVADVGHKIIFNADRLGFPLIEVVTAPEFLTPEETAEGAMRIGRMLRATGIARRGIGAGRQDVNLSIEGGPRVEIKGVPRIPRIPELLSYEARRQASLLKIRETMRTRGISELEEPADVTVYQSESDTPWRNELAATHRAGDTIRLVRLRNAKGLVSHTLAGPHTFAQELSGRVRVIACLDQFPNILHTDGESGGLDREDRARFEKQVNEGSDDVVVVVWGDDGDTMTAANEIMDRWRETMEGIPRETRQALRNNTTDFERVLPGPDRMYPDTDSPPYELLPERIDQAVPYVPDAPWEREERYRALGLPEDIIDRLAISQHAPLFEEITGRNGDLPPMRAGEVLTRIPVALRRADIAVEQLDDSHWRTLLEAMAAGRVKREILFDLLEIWSEKPQRTLDDILEKHGWIDAEASLVEERVSDGLRKARDLRPVRPELHGVLAMSFAMEDLRGRVPGHYVWEKVSAALRADERTAI
ncbi:Glu-tRNA(Gln) amidotransferase subunit GatE [bacterium]|nr:Glu-tRNA(Gln) amidotransferase subunit GatE [bacterium]